MCMCFTYFFSKNKLDQPNKSTLTILYYKGILEFIKMFNLLFDSLEMKYKIDQDPKYNNFDCNNLIDITSTVPYSKICQWRN